jgi:hypothetical protein
MVGHLHFLIMVICNCSCQGACWAYWRISGSGLKMSSSFWWRITQKLAERLFCFQASSTGGQVKTMGVLFLMTSYRGPSSSRFSVSGIENWGRYVSSSLLVLKLIFVFLNRVFWAALRQRNSCTSTTLSLCWKRSFLFSLLLQCATIFPRNRQSRCYIIISPYINFWCTCSTSQGQREILQRCT